MATEKTHTTNYFDIFIEVAEDTKALCGAIPSAKGDKKTVAELQHELIVNNPYQFTSDDVLFQVFAIRNDLAESELEQARKDFFSKGQPCFRASPLTKTFGFGVHADKEGKVAIFAIESEQYKSFLKDTSIKKVKAMRSAKK